VSHHESITVQRIGVRIVVIALVVAGVGRVADGIVQARNDSPAATARAITKEKAKEQSANEASDHAQISEFYGPAAVRAKLAGLEAVLPAQSAVLRFTIANTHGASAAQPVPEAGVLVGPAGTARWVTARTPNGLRPPDTVGHTPARAFRLSTVDPAAPQRILTRVVSGTQWLPAVSSLSLVRDRATHNRLMWVVRWSAATPAAFLADADGNDVRPIAPSSP